MSHVNSESDDQRWGGGDHVPDPAEYDPPLPSHDVLQDEALKTLRLTMKGHGGRNAQSRLGAARAMLEYLEVKMVRELPLEPPRLLRSPEDLIRIHEELRRARQQPQTG